MRKLTAAIFASSLIIFGSLSVATLMGVATHEVMRQSLAVIVTLLCFGTITHWVTPHLLLNFSWLGYLLVCLLLLSTLIIGKVNKGAQRWITLGPLTIQPSEFAKPIGVLVTAQLAASQRKVFVKRVQILSAMLPLVAATFIQPDLGSALVLGAIAACGLLLTLNHWSQVLPLVILGILGAAPSWNLLLYSYQKDRILAFLNPSQNPDTAYNANQAIIAIGSGGLWGRGPGQGVQSTLDYLPEHQTDFFFAAFVEERGLVGAVFLLLLYSGLIFWILVSVSSSLSTNWTVRIIAASVIMVQSTIHIAMNMGISPVTGIPLPLLSSGGSAFLGTGLMLAFIAVLTPDLTFRSRPLLGSKLHSRWLRST